jgi:hypothetical protein
MVATINASVSSSGIVSTADGSGILKVQSNGVTTNALAWVNFNGTTSPGTIRSSYNVSSITKNSTGNYTVNYTSSLSDANYSLVGTSGGSVSGSTAASNSTLRINPGSATPFTTSSAAVTTGYADGNNTDYSYICLAIFGN